MDDGVLQQSSNLEEILVILLQSNSIMPLGDGLIKEIARFMEKIEEKVREKIEEILEPRSRSENYAMLIQFLL